MLKLLVLGSTYNVLWVYTSKKNQNTHARTENSCFSEKKWLLWVYYRKKRLKYPINRKTLGIFQILFFKIPTRALL